MIRIGHPNFRRRRRCSAAGLGLGSHQRADDGLEGVQHSLVLVHQQGVL